MLKIKLDKCYGFSLDLLNALLTALFQVLEINQLPFLFNAVPYTVHYFYSVGSAPSAGDPWGVAGPLASPPHRDSPLLNKQDPFSPSGNN